MSEFTPNEQQYDYDKSYALTYSGAVYGNDRVTSATWIQVVIQSIDNCFVYEVVPYESYSGCFISPAIFTLSETEVEFLRKMAKVSCLFLDAPLGIDYSF